MFMCSKTFIPFVKNPLCLSITAALIGVQSSFSFAQDAELIDEIVITGTLTKSRTQTNNPSPVKSIGTAELELQGIFNPADLIANFTINNGAHLNTDGLNETFSVGTTGANLRGLGDGSTLTLLNGRRQTLTASTTQNGAQFVDLNALIPTIAVGKVEVLKDGASTIYGSDAVAGVVNFLTHQDFTGVELSTNYVKGAEDQDDAMISVMLGKELGDAHWMSALSYFDRSSLSAEEMRDEFELRDARSTFGQPGTFATFGNNGLEFTPDPACEQVAQTNPNTTLGPNAGGFCLFDFGDFFSLVAEEKRLNFYTELRVPIGDGEFFTEFGYANNDVETTTSPTQPILFPKLVPVDNPGNNLGQPALYFGRINGSGSAASIVDIESETLRFSSGINMPINNNWSWTAAATISQNTYDYSDGSDTKVDRYEAALRGEGGPNNNLYYNPLFGADNDQAVLDDMQGFYAYEATSSLAVFDVYTSGNLFKLPAGEVEVVIGAQFLRSSLEYDYNEDAENDNLFFFIGNRSFDDTEHAQAAFYRN